MPGEEQCSLQRDQTNRRQADSGVDDVDDVEGAEQ